MSIDQDKMKFSTVFNVLTIFLKKKSKLHKEIISLVRRNEKDCVLKGNMSAEQDPGTPSSWTQSVWNVVLAGFLWNDADVNYLKVLSAPLFNKRWEKPSARNGVAQLNLTAPSNPAEDKGALQSVLCLEIFVLRKFQRQGGRVQQSSFDSPQDTETIPTLCTYKYRELCRLKRFKQKRICFTCPGKSLFLQPEDQHILASQ